jgi:hypothetical protein
MNLLIGVLFLAGAHAATLVYRGEARVGGDLVYRELHSVTTDDVGQVLRSETVYADPAGAELGRLVNDYRTALPLPEHAMEDRRARNRHGVRYERGRPVMFNRDGDAEETKALNPADYPAAVLVGGQGLHYYLVANLEAVVTKRELPLKFVIPGRLDVYDFHLRVTAATLERVDFEIEIDNWLLKLFAPKLALSYDRKLRRLQTYRGLSNLLDARKKMMNVEIKYRYD